MSTYRHALPQLDDRLFLTDGGIETTLVFHDGIDLPYFAACILLRDAAGTQRLRDYFERYVALALQHGCGFILESATWRASPDWAAKLGWSPAELADVNRRAIDLLVDIRAAQETVSTPMVISGCVGPRGDGYRPNQRMSADEAERYHAGQIGTFGDTAADLVTAITMNYPEEAIGIARAAQSFGMPVVISFTVETDGRLPSGETLKEAIEAVDGATNGAPAYYMLNCAHPTHFAGVLARGESWLERIHGLRANASRRSHAELDEATALDDGDPVELGRQYRELLGVLPHLNVLGGCCGTDHRHVGEIAEACVGHFAAGEPHRDRPR